MSFFFPHSLTKLDDALTKRFLICHDPDDRRIDSEELLSFVESILISNTSSQSPVISPSDVKCLSDFELIAGHESTGEVIAKASHMLICASTNDRDPSEGVMALLDLLGNYQWDAKVVLVLAAFAVTYGEWWLVVHLCFKSHLASSISNLIQISKNSPQLDHHRLKTLSSLFNRLTDLTKSIIKFCALPTHTIPLDDETVSLATSQVHAAAYWVIRITLITSTRVIHLVSPKFDPVKAPAATMWELNSLASRLSSICKSLTQQVEACQRQIEVKLRLRLKDLHTKVYKDNQEVLRMLLGMHDEFFLKNFASQAKPKRASELKNKVVLLLISTPDLLPVETLILLINKLYHPKSNDYELVWVPLAKSTSWSEAEIRSFKLVSNYMPWYSIRRPWHLSQAVIEYIKQAWEFKGQPVMPVLDTQGVVVNYDALDMALVWGAEAFPFSSAKEFELWEAVHFTIEFLMDDIDPLVSTWIEEGSYLCIFGGNDAEWIRNFSTKMIDMINSCPQVKMVYVGSKGLSKTVKNIFRSSERKTTSLSATGLEFFQLRLECIKRSILRSQRANTNHDMIINQVEILLDLKCSQDGWAIQGLPKDTIKILQGEEVIERVTSEVSSWYKNPPRIGLGEDTMGDTEGSDHLETHISPQAGRPCGHFKAVSYDEELVGRTVICDRCKRPMEMFFISE